MPPEIYVYNNFIIFSMKTSKQFFHESEVLHRENGYYNYNKAMNEYKNNLYNVNYNNKGPRIANIKT